MAQIMKYKVGERFFNSLDAANIYAKAKGFKVSKTDAFLEKEIRKAEFKEKVKPLKALFTQKGRGKQPNKAPAGIALSKKLKKTFLSKPKMSVKEKDDKFFNDFFS